MGAPLKLVLAVPVDRRVAGVLRIHGYRERPTQACASSRDPARWPHPAYGRYRLHAIRRLTDAGALAEFGPRVVIFEPEGGAAVAAEAHGVLELAVHAGAVGRDGLLRRTTGGIRLGQREFARFLALVEDQDSVRLEIVPEPLAWWCLVTRFHRRLRPERREEIHAEDRDDASVSQSSRESAGSAWSTGGGRFGGGGTGGSWDDGARRNAAVAGATVAGMAGAAVQATTHDHRDTDDRESAPSKFSTDDGGAGVSGGPSY